MTTTIFLHDAATLRISFPFSQAAVDAIKTIPGATWDKASRTWRAPLPTLDKILSIFPDAALAPEVACAGPPVLPIHHFAATCAAAGVALRLEGERVQGSGGCWTPILQAEIDKRALALRRLLESGWTPPRVASPAPAPQTQTFDRITELDRVMARGEHRWRAAAARGEGYRAAARRQRFGGGDQPVQASMFEDAADHA